MNNLTPKEKWLIARLKRAGYQPLNPNYCEWKETFYKPILPHSGFDWCDDWILTVDRKLGVYFDGVRPLNRPEIHFHLYLPILGRKNWHLLEKAENDLKALITVANNMPRLLEES